MRRLFGLLALSTAGLGLWILLVGPSIAPLTGHTPAEAPATYSAWALGLLMGLTLAWGAAKDWGRLPDWLRLQRRRLGLLLLGGALASLLLLF